MENKTITKVYLTSRLSKDNVVEYNDGMKFNVKVNEMIELVDKEGAPALMVYVKDMDSLLLKRVSKLVDNTVYGYADNLGFTDEWEKIPSAPKERYASNYYVYILTEQIFTIN